jgi:spiro-SPASM protein
MMRRIAIVDTTRTSSHAQKPWMHYANSAEAVVAKLAFADKIYTLGTDEGSLIVPKSATILEIIQILIDTISEPALLIYADANAPFLDPDLLQKMLENMSKHQLQYHFAEGYPHGFSAQIIHSSILPDLLQLAQSHPLKKLESIPNFFFELMRPALNNFDIEVELSPIDLRDRRLDLRYTTKHNAVVAQRFLDAGITDLHMLYSNIAQLDDLDFGVPSYYNFQLTTQCPQACSYCVHPKLASFNSNIQLDLETFVLALERIVEFSGEATIGLSLLGEPALHPQLSQFMHAVYAHPSLKLHIETSGIGWQPEAIDFIHQHAGDRLSIVISQDSFNSKEYQKNRGEGFLDAIHFGRTLLDNKNTSQSVWVQRLRTSALEPGLQAFYTEAKKAQMQIIIQKYHSYAGALPEDRIVELSPSVRRSCWALKREISIFIGGEVRICRLDAKNAVPVGNFYKDSIASLWSGIQAIHQKHLEANYPEICKNCDEYYIYNF